MELSEKYLAKESLIDNNGCNNGDNDTNGNNNNKNTNNSGGTMADTMITRLIRESILTVDLPQIEHDASIISLTQTMNSLDLANTL